MLNSGKVQQVTPCGEAGFISGLSVARAFGMGRLQNSRSVPRGTLLELPAIAISYYTRNAVCRLELRVRTYISGGGEGVSN